MQDSTHNLYFDIPKVLAATVSCRTFYTSLITSYPWYYYFQTLKAEEVFHFGEWKAYGWRTILLTASLLSGHIFRPESVYELHRRGLVIVIIFQLYLSVLDEGPYAAPLGLFVPL